MTNQPPPPESLLQTVQALLRELPLLLSDRIELLSLELQRAGLALATIVALVLAAAAFGVTAWLLLWVGLVVALVEAGLPRTWTLFLALAINVAMACAAVVYARRLGRLLTLPATRRHLMTVSPSTAAPAPPVEPADTPAHGKPAH